MTLTLNKCFVYIMMTHLLYHTGYISRKVTQRTFWHVRPRKTQISLRFRAVWSESSLSVWRKFAFLKCAQLGFWSVCECAGRSESSLCAYAQRYLFCRCFSYISQFTRFVGAWGYISDFNMYEWHYEKTPIQIYWKFYHQNNENIQLENSDILHISAQNIDCGYSLEPPQCFWAEIRKIMYTPVNPSFTI